MDSIFHGLTGLLLGEALPGKTRETRAFWIAAALAPDLRFTLSGLE